ncbi:MAG: uroporphyrinogen-III synthase [Bacteroidota bacterium]|nr:uroporphyrinogen-III synthase [Bacteroidota bacterium]
MQKSKPHILSTRPLAKEIISEAEQNGIIIEELSFIETQRLQDPQLFKKIKELSKQQLTVAFTSMNAVEAVIPHITPEVDWRIYCLGNTTKKLIEEKLGGEKIATTAENAKLLAERMIDDGVKSIVFFCGNIRRDELPNKFRSEKVKVEEVIVYETTEIPANLTREYDGILFFSPSAVNSFFKTNKPGKQTQLFAIGKTTAETIRQYKSQKIIIAYSTDKNALARQAIAYFAT